MAAITAASKIQMIVVQPMETLGITIATYGGQNLGAGKLDRIWKGMRQSMILSMVYCVAACVAVSFLGRYVALLFISGGETAILDEISLFLRINGLFYPVLGILFLLRNGLQGLNYSFLPMLAGVCELVARSAVAFCLVGVYQFGAVCFANPTAWIAADILLIATWVAKSRKLKHDPRFYPRIPEQLPKP